MRALICMLGCIGLTAVVSLPARGVTVRGTLTYEKIPATTQGLDLAHPVEVPAAQVPVEVLTPDLETVLARGATDSSGAYRLDVPDGTGNVVLYATAESGKIQVRDPEDDAPYPMWSDEFDPTEPGDVVIVDEDRSSGPFNILEVLLRAHRLMAQIEPGLPLADLPLVVYWSPDREAGTFRSGNIFYFDGQRDKNSDEFDDSVILSLYGGYLLERFALTTHPGGSYRLSDRLDPRLAWSEGWSYFFAQAVLGTPVYIDTRGPNGKDAFALDLEPDVLQGGDPGYWSVYSVASALWDLFADTSSGSGHLGLGLGPIWRVVREYFPRQAFPYLITLADGLIQQDPSRESGVTAVLAKRGIAYQFGKVPPVPVPFPRLIASGVPATGSIDSLTSGRINLLNSADYYLVHTESIKPLHLRLTVTDEPTPGAGLVHLVVYDARGSPIKGAESWLWGVGDEAELVLPLPADTYVAGVLSYASALPEDVLGSARYQLIAEY